MELFEYEKKHLSRIRETLGECCVLLKSDGSFPLKGPCRIAAYGSGVRKTVKGGTGSGEVNSRYSVSIEEGLEKAGLAITTKKWLDDYDALYINARKDFIKRIKAEAKARKVNSLIYGMGKPMPEFEHDLKTDEEADAAIYVVSRISGEGNDRSPQKGDVRLSESEVRDILYLDGRFERFLLVINSGGVVDLSEVAKVRNILVLSQLGADTGTALADILLGKTYPSGKLTTTWSKWEDYCDLGSFGGHDDSEYKEGIYVGYRYFDSVDKRALFPFGYGKSFTEFTLDNYEMSLDGSKVSVKTEVRNTGKHKGKEVVQVYVSCPADKLDKPYQDLAGFKKTKELLPEESQEIRISFDLRDLASYDEERALYVLEKGDYVVRAGNSSVDTKAVGSIRLDEEVIIRKVKDVCGKPGFKDFKVETARSEKISAGLPVLKMDVKQIECEEISYEHDYPIDEEVSRMSDEELILANIGAFDPKGGLTGFVGNASKSVAGAAGETCGSLQRYGIDPLVLSDGPAGIRISPVYYRDEKGVHGLGQSGIPESMLEFMPSFLKVIMRLFAGDKKLPEGKREEYQYCTAIPIGTAIAQSWNCDLAEDYGDIVGAEMELFNIDLWLAPALNIHRSILCGRNFEYFSEDPLISGRMAAALTRGVQHHPGKGVTIKHFAANNQENNRFGNSSDLSQRALREIYLKGFSICIKEAGPWALMTSYNLINGVHTASSRELIEDVLRREFDFKGIVMTDWIVGDGIMNSKEDIYPKVRPEMVAAAGSDLFMPGCKADYENMRKGLKEGSLSRKQLEINATRLKQLSLLVRIAKGKAVI